MAMDVSIIEEFKDLRNTLEEVLQFLEGSEALKYVRYYPAWKVNQSLQKGDKIQYKNKLYHVLQNTYTVAELPPDGAIDVYREVQADSKVGIREFIKPTASSGYYREGDRIRYKGRIYRSLIDFNGWSPDEWPQGWEIEGTE